MCRHRASSPFAIVGGERCRRVYIDGIEGEESAVELCGPLAVGITAEHITHQFIIAQHRLQAVVLRVALNPTALPVIMPPLGATVF